MRIETDYTQWYDGLFDGDGLLFQRNAFTRGGLSKRAQFLFFERLGLLTPPHGLVTALVDHVLRLGDVSFDERSFFGRRAPSSLLEEVRCVVYLDEFAHRGDGKCLLPLAKAVEVYADAYASLFFPPIGPPVAFRFARFGRRCFWLRQKGKDAEWRSNREDEEELVDSFTTEVRSPVERILFAIDFVPSPRGLLALDFNTAPDLNTLGELGVFSPGEVKEELDASDPAHLRQSP